jgi:phosphohistidine phosphatase
MKFSMAELSTKTILLMRHAKSSWNNPGLRDFDRPLNNRGERDAPRMGDYLKGLKIFPDQVFASPAERAKKTILHVLRQLDLPEERIIWDQDLYFTGAESYIRAIRKAENRSSIVMTVGHNPITEEVIERLIGESINKHIATATIACVQTDTALWKDVDYGSCKLNWIVSPKDIS